MSTEPQNYEDDPIIAALGITRDRPDIPPVDIVFGHFQNMGADFRLHHKGGQMWMQASAARIKHKSPVRGLSRLVLLADRDYEKEVVIGGRVDKEEEGGTTLYATAKTTPWHE